MTPQPAVPTAPEESVRLDSVQQAIADISAGKAVIVVDDEQRENEGDLIFAAELATPELVAFMVRYTSGYVCVALPGSECTRLGLPPMVAQNQDVRGTAYTVTVDLATGSTGISARSRAETIRRLAHPEATMTEFTRPGHVVPLVARDGGVLERNGHTEAAADLARLAGLRPAGVLCEIVSEEDPTEMARAAELRTFADAHGLTMISIAQLIEWRRHHECQVERTVETRLPTEFGDFKALGYRHLIDGQEHVVLVAGAVEDLRGAENVLVRVHSECLTGDALGSQRCDCGPQLQAALRTIAAAGRGVVVYLRGQEGRGIGLLNKLHAYHLQDQGFDTVDANLEQGFAEDYREYSAAGQMLADLGIRSVHLLTNNPTKGAGLAGFGVEILSRMPLEIEPNSNNIDYLRTKRDRMGHDLPQVARWEEENHER